MLRALIYKAFPLGRLAAYDIRIFCGIQLALTELWRSWILGFVRLNLLAFPSTRCVGQHGLGRAGVAAVGHFVG